MKKLFTLFVVAGLAAVGLAGEGWLTDFEEAKKQAAEKNRPILVDFAGSDWCRVCVRLDREVFSQPEFKAYAAENVILFLADFPKRKPQSAEVMAQNGRLLAQHGVFSFPTVLLLNADGSVIARTGYQPGGAVKYVQHIKELLK